MKTLRLLTLAMVALCLTFCSVDSEYAKTESINSMDSVQVNATAVELTLNTKDTYKYYHETLDYTHEVAISEFISSVF